MLTVLALSPQALTLEEALSFGWPDAPGFPWHLGDWCSLRTPALAPNITQRWPGAAPSGFLLALPILRAESASTSSDLTAASAPIHTSMGSPGPIKTSLPSAVPLPHSASSSGLKQDSPTACPLLLPPVLLPHFHNPELRAHSASGPDTVCVFRASVQVPVGPLLCTHMCTGSQAASECAGCTPPSSLFPEPTSAAPPARPILAPALPFPHTQAETGCCDSACPWRPALQGTPSPFREPPQGP